MPRKLAGKASKFFYRFLAESGLASAMLAELARLVGLARKLAGKSDKFSGLAQIPCPVSAAWRRLA